VPRLILRALLSACLACGPGFMPAGDRNSEPDPGDRVASETSALEPVVALFQPETPSNSGSTTATPAPEAAADEWLLMRSLRGTWFGSVLAENRIQVYGWTDLSFTASTDRSSNLPLGFNYRANDFLLDQNWLRIDRPVDTNSSDPSFGFRSDTILPGSDYRFTLARGLFSGQLTDDHGGPNPYGIDPIQFYGEVYFPSVAQGMDVKIGHFFSQYGVETTDTINTPLFSHAYTDLYDPFTHTGILTTTKLSDAWTVQAGLVTGSDVFIDPADTPTFIGSAKWSGKDQNDSVLFNVILGSGRFNQSRDFHNPEIFDLVYTHKFSDKLSYSFEGLFGFTTDVPNIGTAEWFGVLNYLTYGFSPRVSSTTRLEFFDDIQGERTQFPGLYTALTTGLSFKPWPWLIVRPELRYDNNAESAPFEGKHWLFTAATDMILRW
jgi:hypothetical protein